MRRIFTAILACAAALNAAVLFSGGKATSSIVIEKDASEPVMRAASELALWLEKSSGGIKFEIADEPKTGLTPIYLGKSKFATEHGFNPDALKPDGYFIKSTDDYLIIAGRDYKGGPFPGIIHPQRVQETWNNELKLSAFGEMGTLNGVARTLEEFAGIRWYMTGDLGTVVPTLKKLKIPKLEKTNAPDFEYRYPWFCNFPDSPRDVLWYRRVGFGALAPISINHSYVIMQKYRDSHPEYFALIDGKRDFDRLSVVIGGGNFCLSNKELQDRWVEHICSFFERNPDQMLYPLCPNDGVLRICECPECQAQLSPELGETGKFSNYVWTFTDKIARRVAERCPGKMVGTFAYEKYRVVPTKPAEIALNVAVMICYTRQKLADPEKKAEVLEALNGWSKKTKNLYLWTYPIYDYWMPWRGMPRFYPKLLQENFRLIHKLGVRGEFLESEFSSGAGDPVAQNGYGTIAYPGLSHLTAYLSVKLLWDADANVDAILKEYYKLFYGKGGDAMKRFWMLAEKVFLANYQADHPIKVYTPELIGKFYALLDEASSKVKNDSLEYKRIALIRSEMQPFTQALINMAEKRTLVAKKVSSLTITNDLDGTVWKDALKYDLLAKDGTPAVYETKMFAAADDEGLGITVICMEKEMDKLTVRSKTDEDTVWDDDSIEIFFEGVDGTNGHQFILTANGVLWDGSWKERKGPVDTKWKSNTKSATWKLADRWIAQVIIPWADLGVTGEPNGKLVANVYRNRVCGKTAVHATFNPTMSSHHRETELFGKLEVK